MGFTPSPERSWLRRERNDSCFRGVAGADAHGEFMAAHGGPIGVSQRSSHGIQRQRLAASYWTVLHRETANCYAL